MTLCYVVKDNETFVLQFSEMPSIGHCVLIENIQYRINDIKWSFPFDNRAGKPLDKTLIPFLTLRKL